MKMDTMMVVDKKGTVDLVEELCDARKSESCKSAFDRLVGRFQLVQQAHLLIIIIITNMIIIIIVIVFITIIVIIISL